MEWELNRAKLHLISLEFRTPSQSYCKSCVVWILHRQRLTSNLLLGGEEQRVIECEECQQLGVNFQFTIRASLILLIRMRLGERKVEL